MNEREQSDYERLYPVMIARAEEALGATTKYGMVCPDCNWNPATFECVRCKHRITKYAFPDPAKLQKVWEFLRDSAKGRPGQQTQPKEPPKIGENLDDLSDDELAAIAAGG